MFNMPDELVKGVEFLKELEEFCNQRGYAIETTMPTILFCSPEGSMVTFDAKFKHKLHNSEDI